MDKLSYSDLGVIDHPTFRSIKVGLQGGLSNCFWLKQRTLNSISNYNFPRYKAGLARIMSYMLFGFPFILFYFFFFFFIIFFFQQISHEKNKKTAMNIEYLFQVQNKDKSWMGIFPEAKVHHFSMSSPDHCLLTLLLKNSQPKKSTKKCFLFEAMWTREEGCRKELESVQDPFRGDLEYKITDRLKNYQVNLQRWNWRVFGNVNRNLKQKQSRLQQLESLDSLHEKAEEIQGLKKEINKILAREEILWN